MKNTFNFHKKETLSHIADTKHHAASKKRRRLWLTPLFAFILILCKLSVSSAVPEEDILILWQTELTESAVTEKLSAFADDLVLSEHLGDFSICRTTGQTKTQSLLSKLTSLEDILLAEQDAPISLSTVPNDTFFNAQWALDNSGMYSYYIDTISILRNSAEDIDLNITEAWNYYPETATHKPVVVAIIDTGVDIEHPELAGRIWTNSNEIPANGVDDDANGYIDDYNGWDFYNNDATVVHYLTNEDGSRSGLAEDSDDHGTLCAGIIAASANNNEGIAGIASNINVQILPLKIHGGVKGSGSVSNAVKAVRYATAMGADICNMSWGTANYSETLQHVMQESDMLFIAAAGNNGHNNNSTPMYPACYALDNLISVAYIDAYGNLASDSNYGTSTVDVAAPGADIYSTVVGGYSYANGTSMAAPHVTGIAALLYACGDNLYPANIKEIILNNLKPLDNLIGFVKHPGIPNAEKIVAAADTLASDTTPPVLEVTSSFRKETILLQTRSEDLGGSGVRLIKYAPGERDVSYFAHGTIGTSIQAQTAEVNKAGMYTFYISDYAGNETVSTYFVQEDVEAPVLSAAYTHSDTDNTFLITLTANDAQSGIKVLRYLPGTHSIDSFLAAGTDLPLEGNTASFTVASSGIYSICAIDYRGNKTKLELNVEIYPALDIALNITGRTLFTGDTYPLLPVLLPFYSTDSIRYESSDNTILTVSPDGLVTAHAAGVATVTVTAKSGVATTATFLIKETALQ